MLNQRGSDTVGMTEHVRVGICTQNLLSLSMLHFSIKIIREEAYLLLLYSVNRQKMFMCNFLLLEEIASMSTFLKGIDSFSYDYKITILCTT